MNIRKQTSYYLQAFVFAFIIALSIFLPYIILDKGLFIFYGDFNVQQVPFYMLMHHSVRSGNVFWSWLTDLGSNFLGSYTFYNIGSPFFWLTLPLPDKLVPYCMGPLLILKISTASLTSYGYIQRFVKTKELAVLGGLLYAFSSFSIYNIFFNHFHEAMAFFPLMLIALEELVQHKRKGMFALTVLLNCFCNYFFFIAQAVFLFLYWIIRALSGDWELNFKKFFRVGFEAVLGIGLASVLFIPAILQVTGNTRVNNILSGWNLLVYGWTERLPDILHSVFFPQDLPARLNFYPDSGAPWSSVAAWLPLFGMVGVISYMYARRGSWLKRIIATCFVFALVPGLNAVFVLMVDSYYGRWFYMGVLFLATASAVAFDNTDIDLMHGLKWTAFLSAAIALPIGLIPQKDSNGKITKIGLEAYPDRFWIYVAIVAGGLFVSFVLIKLFRKDKLKFANYATVAVTVLVCIYGNYFISTGKTLGEQESWFKPVALEGASRISLPKSSDGNYDYRIDVLNGYNSDSMAMDNQSLFWQIPSIQCFNSVISASTMKFYPAVGVTRDVGSRPSPSYVGLRALLSVRYMLDQDANDATPCGMSGFKALASSNGNQLGFKVFENKNYIPIGFTYDSYITQAEFNSASQKDCILLKGMLLNSAQIKKYSGILQMMPDYDTYWGGDDMLASSCAERRKHTCTNFSRDNSGFSASIALPKENLVFFSVPYDKGWTATVNGKPAAIEEVNVGFMAVLCPAGTSTIRFSYMTPGLKAGMCVTGVSILVLFGYLFGAQFVMKIRNRKAAGAETAPEGPADGSPVLPETSEETPPETPVSGDQPDGEDTPGEAAPETATTENGEPAGEANGNAAPSFAESGMADAPLDGANPSGSLFRPAEETPEESEEDLVLPNEETYEQKKTTKFDKIAAGVAAGALLVILLYLLVNTLLAH